MVRWPFSSPAEWRGLYFRSLCWNYNGGKCEEFAFLSCCYLAFPDTFSPTCICKAGLWNVFAPPPPCQMPINVISWAHHLMSWLQPAPELSISLRSNDFRVKATAKADPCLSAVGWSLPEASLELKEFLVNLHGLSEFARNPSLW